MSEDLTAQLDAKIIDLEQRIVALEAKLEDISEEVKAAVLVLCDYLKGKVS